MGSRVFKFLIGAMYLCYQGLTTASSENLSSSVDDVYIAELMVESNGTLEASTILSVLNSTALTLTITGASHTVTLLHSELISECLIIGDDSFNCNCSNGYIWSNEVCDTSGCCSETTCTKNVSYITPLCIAKVQVQINGSILTSSQSWSTVNTQQLVDAFQGLNGFEYLNITGQRLENKTVDFEAAVSVKFVTSKLQAIVSALETSLAAVIWIDTRGLVTIEYPETKVCYMSNPALKCTFEEATGSAGWNMSRKHERFELNTGSVAKLRTNCTTDEYKSCVAVTIHGVTALWAGTYECGFTNGSVRHTARTELHVALLPDEIILRINPLTVDCSENTVGVTVDITATILNISESFEIWWSYRGGEPNKNLVNTSSGDYLVYSFTTPIDCQPSPVAQYVNITFKNMLSQEKSAQVDIPVIYKGSKFCSEEIVNGEFWPKTPAGDTVINRTCEAGKTGFKSRTCEGTTWQKVYSYCISEDLNKISNAADNFQKGLGATQEVALDVFEGLKNSSTSNSTDLTSTMADISASVRILDVMASSSANIVLQESIFPDLVTAASNMLNKTWDKDNASVVDYLSSNYLQSMENLVKNTHVNQINGLNSQNLDLKFCSSSKCTVSVFDIDVNVNKTSGMIKTVAVKNLMNKLSNNFPKTVTTDLLISATLKDSNDSSLEIRLDFPRENLQSTTALCVFWNTTAREWSEEGCTVKISDENHTVCECNHLTSFSILMAKNDISNEDLSLITNIGLGVSICSLLIFLIIEALVWSAVVKTNLSHFRHTAMVNIAMFLLLADCSFLASISPEILGDNWCLVFTMCKHLFFLAMFSWMLCLSAMLVHQLIFVFSPLRKRVLMFISSIVGYVCPILIVGSSYVYFKYTNKPYHDKEKCWLVFERLLEGSVHAFLLPVGTVILINLFSMVVVILTLMKSSVPDGSKADERDTAKSILKVVVFLTPVFGVTWAIGYFLLILETDNPLFTVANYSFTILNSFQGFFILLTGCFAETKVRQQLIKLIMAKSKGKSESEKNLNSTTYTKDK